MSEGEERGRVRERRRERIFFGKMKASAVVSNTYTLIIPSFYSATPLFVLFLFFLLNSVI
jgi:hypothetical protein